MIITKHFTLLILLISLSMSAQFPIPEIDFPYREKYRKIHFEDFLAANSNEIYTIGTTRNNYTEIKKKDDLILRKYNAVDFAITDEKMYPSFKYNDHHTFYRNAWLDDGIVHILFDCEGDGQTHLLHRTIGKGGEMSSIDLLGSIEGEWHDRPTFNLTFSRDSSMIFMALSKKIDDKRTLTGFKLFNNKLEEIKNLPSNILSSFKSDSSRYRLISSDISNKGDVFMLGFSLTQEQAEARISKNYKERANISNNYRLFKKGIDNSEAEYDLSNLNKSIYSAFIRADIQGNIIVAGFFSPTKDEPISGCFHITLDPENLNMISEDFQDFAPSFLDDFSSISSSEEAISTITDMLRHRKAGLNAFIFKDIVVKDDGSMTIIAEQTYTDQVTSTSAGMYVTTTMISTNSVIIMNISPEGNIDWVTHIPKIQYVEAVKNSLGSYFVHQKNNTLYFIFNGKTTDVEQFKIGEDPVVFRSSSPFKNAILLATVNTAGELSYHLLSEHSEDKALLYTDDFQKISNHEFLMYFSNFTFQKSGFARISFP